jgi:ribosomal protein L7/L12
MNIVEINGKFYIAVGGANVSVKAVQTLLAHVDNTVLIIKVLREMHDIGLLEAKNVVMFVKMAQSLGD